MNGHGRSAALLWCAVLLAASLAPGALAGTRDTFEGGPTADLSPSTGTAVVSLPNPSRAVGASVDLQPLRSVESQALALTAAWGFQFAACATAAVDPAAYRQAPLGSGELSSIASEDGASVNLSIGGQRPGLLFEVQVPPRFLDPVPWNVTVRLAAATDGPQPPPPDAFTLAFFTTTGYRPWRALPLDVAADNASVLETTADHPATAGGQSGPSIVGIVVPNNGSAETLVVDSLTVTVRRLVLPDSPQLAFRGSTGSFWQYNAPGAVGGATLGRAHSFEGGAPEFLIGSDGTAADGDTPPVYLPEGAWVDRGFLELVPDPITGSGVASGGPSAAPAGGGSTAGEVGVGSVPLTARPTYANVALRDLTATGVPDASQLTALTTQVIGNASGAERAAAQTFTLESDGLLTAIALNFTNATGRPTAPLAVEVRDVSGGGPGNTTLSSATANGTLARQGGLVTFTLLTPLAVTAGQQLAVVVTAPGVADGEYWEWRRHDGLPSDPYANGSAFVAANASGEGAWTGQPALDFTFRALMEKPVDTAQSPLVSVAGSIGPGVPSPLPGNRTEYVYTVPGLAVGIDPAGAGSGRWNVTVGNGLPTALRFNWSVYLTYALYPRNVEVSVGAEAAAIMLPELDLPTVVDVAGAVAAALASGNISATPGGLGNFHGVVFHIHADGPAPIRVRSVDLAYDVTLQLAGFSSAMNAVLSAVNSSAPLADAVFELLAVEGAVRLSNLSVTYSEPPQFFPQAPAQVQEGVQNETVADLLHLFTDDLDPLNLTFQVMSVFASGSGNTTAVATAAVHRSALDANLTVTMQDPEFSGLLVISVLATDTSGLSAVGAGITVQVAAVDDPPEVPAQLPAFPLAGLNGTFDLAPFVHDNDTAAGSLVATASSPFASVSGLVLSFDYRGAPPSLLQENVSISISDGTTAVTTVLPVLIQNAGRPTIDFTGASLTVTAGRNITVDLGNWASDDDTVANLSWELLLVEGDGTAALSGPHTLRVSGTAAGSVAVTLSARDREQNLANGTLVITVRANSAPRFTAFDGQRVTLSRSSPLTIDLREFLSDPDDPFTNISISLGWQNGSLVTANVTDGVLTVARVGDTGGHAAVTVTAADPSGATASATLEVDVEGPAPGSGTLLLLLGAALAALILGVFMYRSYRHGQARRGSLGRMRRETGAVELDEDEKRLLELEGLETTEEERMLGKIEEMEREAGASRLELPPVSILSAPGPAATTSLLLLYRDGRPVAWVAASSPSEREAEVEQELAAAVAERLKKGSTGARIEDEFIEMGGWTFALEARAQLVLAARVEGGAKNQALRHAMRIALDEVFDRNTGALKRWDGSPRSVKGVDDVLEAVMRVAPVPGGDPARTKASGDEE